MARSPLSGYAHGHGYAADQQHLASIYFYDDDATIITFTDIKEIAERADFPSRGWVTLTSGKVYRYAEVPLQAFEQLPRRRERRQTLQHLLQAVLQAGGLTAHFATPELRRGSAGRSG